jgi:hypothetical protein
MNDGHVEDSLIAHARGELTGAERAHIEDHVSLSPEEHQAARRNLQRLRQMPPSAPRTATPYRDQGLL